MEDEVTMEDVATCNHLQTVYDIVVLRVTVRGEEILQDLQEEEDLGEVQEGVHILVTVVAEGHNVEVKQHIWDDDDANDEGEDCHGSTGIAQNVAAGRFSSVPVLTNLLICLCHN